MMRFIIHKNECCPPTSEFFPNDAHIYSWVCCGPCNFARQLLFSVLTHSPAQNNLMCVLATSFVGLLQIQSRDCDITAVGRTQQSCRQSTHCFPVAIGSTMFHCLRFSHINGTKSVCWVSVGTVVTVCDYCYVHRIICSSGSICLALSLAVARRMFREELFYLFSLSICVNAVWRQWQV